MTIWKRIRMWRRRRSFEQDLAEEVRIHREMSGAAAFGSEALALEQSREVWGFAWLDSWKQDIRYALRGLRRSPGFTARGDRRDRARHRAEHDPLHGVQRVRAAAIRRARSRTRSTASPGTARPGTATLLAGSEYQALREQRTLFSDVLAYDNLAADARRAQTCSCRPVPRITSHAGVGMAIGSAAAPGDRRVMVLSYDAWRNKFGADPAMIGRKVYMRGQPFEVVGIAESAVRGPRELSDRHLGSHERCAFRSKRDRTTRALACHRRLQPGVPVERPRRRC